MGKSVKIAYFSANFVDLQTPWHSFAVLTRPPHDEKLWGHSWYIDKRTDIRSDKTIIQRNFFVSKVEQMCKYAFETLEDLKIMKNTGLMVTKSDYEY